MVDSKAESWLKRKLDYRFRNADLLRVALTHRSSTGESNERLEFLGDAVLDLVISEVLFRSHATASEGDLSRLRASLVKDETLAELAAGLGLGDLLVLGSGERKTGGHRRESILADALEAIFGAVYLDSGFDAARAVIETAYGDRLRNFPPIGDLRDAKTRLQELLQAQGLGLPAYELVETTGKAHRRVFAVSCTVDGIPEATRGTGTTRRKAEQQAAESMLAALNPAAAK